MTRSPGYCGVILAAGTPERLHKSLFPWPVGNELSSSLLSSHIDVLNTISELVLVVAGSNEALITPTVYAHGGYLVSASEATPGDFASLRLGLREVLNRGRDTAIITPVDIPPLTSESYRTLCAAYQDSERTSWAVVPKGSAYPLIAGRELIEQILRAPVDSSLAEVMSANAAHVLAVDLDNNSAANANSEQLAT